MLKTPLAVVQRILVPSWSLCALFLLSACGNPSHQTNIALGDAQTLTDLYSYPNKPGSTESLADTIKHYLEQSTARDGLVDVKVTVTQSDTTYTAQLQSRSAAIKDYADRVPAFLNIGKLAYTGAQELQQTPIWQSDWRFFLPLGLALTEQHSVQLLHFPPDYSLPEQDYLGSKTSQRWESLLEVNGVRAADVTRYEAIVDIAPIAAPASDGEKLEGTYSYFSEYAHQLLSFLVTSPPTTTSRSVVAYGTPVHAWVEQQFGVKLEVLSTGYLTLDQATQAPVLGANHPSYFWYAAEESCDLGWDVMRQDLIAARWQARMSTPPQQSAEAVLKEATAYWDARHPQICTLTVQQATACAGKPMQQCPDQP